MKYRAFVFLYLFGVLLSISPQQAAFPSVEPADFAEIILDVFPEAYRQFLTISYEYDETENILTPVEASFLVPARYFYSRLTDYEMERRLQILVKRLEICWASHEIGPEEEYAWLSWEDKLVRKVTLSFARICG